jgi:phthalate 4,5-dioxygenase
MVIGREGNAAPAPPGLRPGSAQAVASRASPTKRRSLRACLMCVKSPTLRRVLSTVDRRAVKTASCRPEAMLTHADNELLCRVGPGTAMGDYFRRFWLPACLAVEVAPDGPPLRTRILGEDLLIFRATDGTVGLVGDHCPHRGASLFFGRNEEGGLRCVYHGWKFDVAGACIDMPNEPPESDFKSKVRAIAYPCQEWGGLVWTYMGPTDRSPQLPQLEWACVPPDHRRLGRWIHQASWLQVLEGDIDSSHSMFLHRALDPTLQQRSRRFGVLNDLAPRLSVQQTDYGFVYGGQYRTVDAGVYNWRLTQWMLPSHTMIASKQFPVGGRVYVPVDDEHVNIFNYRYHPERPLNENELAFIETPLGSPRRERDTLALSDGRRVDTWRLLANRDNDYLIDRERQHTGNYTGILGIQEQDKAMTESMGPIVNRSQEHLGTSDLAIIAARRRLLRVIRELQEGVEPDIAARGDAYRVRSLDVVSTAENLHDVVAQHRADLLAIA